MSRDTTTQTRLMRNVGNELRRLRESKGFTQGALAELVAISRPHLSQVELGRTWASVDLLSKCDEVFETPGVLVGLLRSAKVPEQDAKTPGDALDLTSHKFMPVKLAPHVRMSASADSIDLEGHGVSRHVLSDDDGITCDVYVFPFGVAVMHLREHQRFANIAGLSLWRHDSYPAARSWARCLLDSNTELGQPHDLTPPYVLSVFEVHSVPWTSAERQATGMRLLSVPSTLLDRRDERTFATISRAEQAEQELLQSGFDHPDIVDFGIKGTSTAFASWAGVTYFAHAPTRCLPFADIVEWEMFVQALWCYCDWIVNHAHDGAAPDVDPEFGERFLARTAARLPLAHAREHLQKRLMKDAVTNTSRLPVLLDQARHILRDCAVAAN
jgi:transcriptional regulator with XRE-family HTH domain